ncbi:MAG: efflux RND transporter periplasmic adaptor subunit [Treponemataceae bacterium]|nr:efflux RND transporter periplasmic adaptor subunit [Treponemataceae bacterium]
MEESAVEISNLKGKKKREGKLKAYIKNFKFTPTRIAKLIIVSLITLFILTSFVMKLSGKKGPVSKKPVVELDTAVTVSVKELKKETIQSTVKLTGNVSSVSEISIYPDTSGKITNIVKKLGDYVNKGDKIAYVDASKPGSSYVASPAIATVSGTIIDLPVSLGDTVTSATSIATIGSLKDLQLKVYVAEKYSDYLKEGMKAYISLTSIPDEKFEARVAKVSPVVNKSNRTIETELRFTKYDSRIKPGMFASVDLVIKESKNSLVIPKSCITNFNGNDSVLVMNEEGMAVRTEITTGLGNDLDVAVTSGLEPGMKVIIAGSATDGSKVRIAGE